MRVLIVDDEASIRKTTALAVETMGHEAVAAPSGARARAALAEGPFDACFLDVKLGAEDGWPCSNNCWPPPPGSPW
jgi:NtrC-family two-component system response regulator AlgB